MAFTGFLAPAQVPRHCGLAPTPQTGGVPPLVAYEQDKPKKKRQATPKKTFSEPFVDKLGWSVEPPSLIWR